MARLSANAVKLFAAELFDYEIPAEAAETVARMVGANGHYARRMESLKLSGIQPPFGYPTMIVEAERLRRQRS